MWESRVWNLSQAVFVQSHRHRTYHHFTERVMIPMFVKVLVSLGNENYLSLKKHLLNFKARHPSALKFGFWLMIVFAEVKVSEHLKSWQLNLEFGSLFFLQKSWTQMKICLPTHCFESDCSQQFWTVECFFLPSVDIPVNNTFGFLFHPSFQPRDLFASSSTCLTKKCKTPLHQK